MNDEEAKTASSSVVTKRGRGRPRKYLTAEEKRDARRGQILKSVRAWRQRQAQQRSSPPDDVSQTNSLITPAITPGTTSGEELPFDTSAWTNISPQDSASVQDWSEEELYNNAVILFQAQDEAIAPSIPMDVTMGDKTMFMNNLFMDFRSCVQVEEEWWPYSATATLPGLAGQLLEKSHIAAWASSVGMMRKDPGMLRLGESANLDTIKLLRKYTNDHYVQRLAIPLVIMAYDLINYEFKEFMRGDTTVPSTMTWAMHGMAATAIVQQTGPNTWSTGLGAKVLLGLLPQHIIISCGLRVRMIFDADDWLAMLQKMEYTAFKDSVWPLAIHIPTLMQELDIILATRPTSSEAAFADALQDMYRRVRLLSAHFDGWIAMFPKDARSSAELFQPSTQQTVSRDVFHPRIEFATRDAGNSMMLYWTFKLLLAILANDIYQHLANTRACKCPKPTHDLPAQYAHLICRAVPYWLRTGSFSSYTVYMCMSWPLRVAKDWLSTQDNMEEHVAWCANMSNTIRALRVGNIGEYIVDFMYSNVSETIGRRGSQIQPPADPCENDSEQQLPE